MKSSISIFFFIICSLLSGICHAQWQPDVRLTDNPAGSFTSDNNAWCIAANGNTLHVVWYDNRDGNYEIYYKRSTDGGTSWGTDTRLTNNAGISNYPSVAVSGTVVHVVWSDSRDTGIYYKRSTDGGTSWGADQRLTNQTALFANSFRTSVAVSGTVVHVVWHDLRDGNIEVYYKRSPDGGASWGADTLLTNHTGQSANPSVTVSGSAVHVAWEEQRDGNPEIYYKRSADGGVSWGADTRLTMSGAESQYPSVAVSGSVVHVVWTDDRDGNWEIYCKRDPTGNTVGIIPIGNIIPDGYSLSQNYPNPFNPSTKIKFDVPKSSFVKLAVYDMLGREVSSLVNEQLEAGTYEYEFEASGLNSGVYFYKISTENFSEIKKMLLVK